MKSKLTHDWIAVGAVRAFREAGLSIPKDIAIIGFADMPICAYIDPLLTTIHVPKRYMGQIAIQRLHECIQLPDSKPIKIEIFYRRGCLKTHLFP